MQIMTVKGENLDLKIDPFKATEKHYHGLTLLTSENLVCRACAFLVSSDQTRQS